MSLVALVVVLIVLALLLYAVQLLPLDQTLVRIAQAALVLLVALWILAAFGLFDARVPLR